uniref:Major facilitator superfamily (MFS) profile domain-containing protein n=1 Tax=Timema cristinae TaxID=61476 RepID=A0A7R9H4M2_TIMCR|nr:unnamed protein product [Timema cristinae]
MAVSSSSPAAAPTPHGRPQNATHHKQENNAYPHDDWTVLTDTELGPWWQFWKRRRYLLAILVFLALFNVSALDASMGAAMVAMTTNYSIDIGNGTTLHVNVGTVGVILVSPTERWDCWCDSSVPRWTLGLLVRDLDWDMTSRGVVEGSFLYGSLLSQVPGGWLAGRVGAHRLLGLGVASAALLALFVPALAYSHVSLLVALRVFQGILQGILQVGYAFLWSCTSSRGFYRWGMLSCGVVLLPGDSTGGVCFLVELYFFQGILQVGYAFLWSCTSSRGFYRWGMLSCGVVLLPGDSTGGVCFLVELYFFQGILQVGYAFLWSCTSSRGFYRWGMLSCGVVLLPGDSTGGVCFLVELYFFQGILQVGYAFLWSCTSSRGFYRWGMLSCGVVLLPGDSTGGVCFLVELYFFQGILQVGYAFLWSCTSSRGFYRWGMLSCGVVLLPGDSTGGVCFLVELYFFQGILQVGYAFLWSCTSSRGFYRWGMLSCGVVLLPGDSTGGVCFLVELYFFQGILQVGYAFLWSCTSSRGFYRWGMLSCGVVLLPGDSTGGVCFLVELYFFQGILQGVTLPCINALWSRWAPPLERSQLATLALSGSYLGTAVSVPLSGAIADGIGWPAIFYVFGLLGLVWFVAWWMLVKECPERDPHISVEELKYIQNSLGPQEKIYKLQETKFACLDVFANIVVSKKHGPDQSFNILRPTICKRTSKSVGHVRATIHPWREILTSLPFWAITVAHFVEIWGFHSLINQLPDFVKDTSGSYLKRDGFLAVLPFLVTAGLMQLSGQVADWLLATGFTMATIIRKLYICGAFLGEVVLLIVLVFLNTASGVIVCVSLASAFQACTWAALSVNHLELAPRHAGVLMGVSQTVATLAAITSPLFTGCIVRNKRADEWRLVLYVAAALYLSGAVFYGMFGSAEKQVWAEEPPCIIKENDCNRRCERRHTKEIRTTHVQVLTI